MTKIFARAIVGALAVAVVALCLSASALAQDKTMLTVYSTLSYDVFQKYEAAFEAANPDIDIQHVHDSGGVVTARLLAEKDNPQADDVPGEPDESFGCYAVEFLLEHCNGR